MLNKYEINNNIMNEVEIDLIKFSIVNAMFPFMIDLLSYGNEKPLVNKKVMIGLYCQFPGYKRKPSCQKQDTIY